MNIFWLFSRKKLGLICFLRQVLIHKFMLNKLCLCVFMLFLKRPKLRNQYPAKKVQAVILHFSNVKLSTDFNDSFCWMTIQAIHFLFFSSYECLHPPTRKWIFAVSCLEDAKGSSIKLVMLNGKSKTKRSKLKRHL